jgi:sugar transferase (PEP-CTERM/EpsH1 system associated)
MADLLYLLHRLPYPPYKGEKVRSFHLLKRLLAGHRLHLGSFADDPADETHLSYLRGLCASLHVERLHPIRARLASLAGLLSGDALTPHYCCHAGLARWVDETVARENIAATVVFSSSMAQYAQRHPRIPMLLDFVDVDSAKWTDYAPKHRWPMSRLYRRKGQLLLAGECAVAQQAIASYVTTEKEAGLFRRLAPKAAAGVQAINNGVDAQYFAPDAQRATPFGKDELPLVFTGAMDYWRNVDAVGWFAAEVLPLLRKRWPVLRLHFVGRSPTPVVSALASDAVTVACTVPDLRPYLQHAAVVVAPLRLARGIQNKILEATAMERPVAAAGACVDALQAEHGTEVLTADAAADYARCIEMLLQAPERAAASDGAVRRRVLQTYDWSTYMALIERRLSALGAVAAVPA